MLLSSATIAGLFLTGTLAGVLGALMGVGGGIIVVPALVLVFGFDIKIAVAASLVAVVASSTAAGSVYVGRGMANMRLGMLLEIATTLGAVAGGLLAAYSAPNILSGLFAIMLMLTSFFIFRARTTEAVQAGVQEEDRGHLGGTYYDSYSKRTLHYAVENLPFGGAISFFAGLLSGLLGVGGGFVKVPAMHLGMKVPMRVATATSNFMIGVTAVSSLFVYVARGLVYPLVAAPVVLGVVGGALAGTVLVQKISAGGLKKLFAVVMLLVAAQMFLNALGVGFGK